MTHQRKPRLKTFMLGYYTFKEVGKEKKTGRPIVCQLTELKPTKFPKRKYSGKWKFMGRRDVYDTYQEVL